MAPPRENAPPSDTVAKSRIDCCALKEMGSRSPAFAASSQLISGSSTDKITTT